MNHARCCFRILKVTGFYLLAGGCTGDAVRNYDHFAERVDLRSDVVPISRDMRRFAMYGIHTPPGRDRARPVSQSDSNGTYINFFINFQFDDGD